MMRKALGIVLVCFVLALALTVAAGTGILDRMLDPWGQAAPSQAATLPNPTLPSRQPTPRPTLRPTADIGQALSYFSAVAFSTEYGGTENDEGRVRKWEQPILITVDGSPTEEDLRVLDGHIAALGAVPGMPEIRRVRSGGNVEIHFVPLSGMALSIPGYVEGNWGFFRVWWDDSMVINRTAVGIATDVTTQVQRNHLILEEVTQMLGLMQDSDSRADSIFYAPWTEVQALSQMDWQMVAMLYRSDIRAGMTRDAAMAILTPERRDDHG